MTTKIPASKTPNQNPPAPTKIDLLREKLQHYRKERAQVLQQKGKAANLNKDLRENADYDFWENKEAVLTTRIREIMQEIYDQYNKQKKSSSPKRN